MDVTMLLCDAADESGGKLYVLGGGWSIIRGQPSPMALAIKMSVPWDQANHPFSIKTMLVTDDGEPVPGPDSEDPLVVEGTVEVGRPTGLKPGTPLDTPFVLSFPPLPLEPGGYVWELEIDGTTMARAPFRVEPS
jgi:hypothetical protein